MRRALGLSASGGGQTPQQRPEQARQRHRFVQDGGVPVVVLNHKTDTDTAALRERIASLEGALEAERASHKSTRAALSEQQALATAIQTRLAHAEFAHREAIAQERALRTQAQEALAMQPPRRAVREAVARAEPPVAAAASSDGVLPPKPKRGRPRSATPPEPKPVRWWTPSFKAKMKA